MYEWGKVELRAANRAELVPIPPCLGRTWEIDMPLDSIANTLPQWVTMLVSPLTLLVGALVIVSLRSGSPHAIWSQLWTFAAGNSRGKQAGGALREVLSQRQCLLEFRVKTGIRARTPASALRIAEWAEQQCEDLEDVGRCRGFFDVDAIQLRAPLHRAWELVLVALATGVLFLYLWVAPLAVSPRVWVILPKGTWITYGTKDVTTIWSHQRLTQADCADGNVDGRWGSRSLREQADLRVACNALTNKQYGEQLADGLHGQRIAAFSLALGAAPLAYLVHYVCAGAMAVRAMTRRIKKRRGEEGREVRRLRRWRARARALWARVRSTRHGGMHSQRDAH